MVQKAWCPYCGRPLDIGKDVEKAWRYHSPKGGSYFLMEIFKCPRCKRRVRLTTKEPGRRLER